MESIVIFGKGGIGKSMIATSLSYACSLRGLRVLHVGCDPKADSTWRLTRGRSIPPVIEQYIVHQGRLTRDQIVFPAINGIHCVETGGPEPGVGCGGRGVALMLQTFDDIGLLRDEDFDVVIFDVLGDIVCGGFAAPLRRGFGRKVLIIASEELMALYAANNIARALRTYRDNGVVLAGIVANLRDNSASLDTVRLLAQRIGAPLLDVIRRDPLILEAERHNRTVLEHAPESPSAQQLDRLASAVLDLDPASLSVPDPLDPAAFRAFVRDAFNIITD